MEYLTWQNISLAVTGFITVASVIVRLTPYETENKWLFKFVAFMELISFNTKPIIKKQDL